MSQPYKSFEQIEVENHREFVAGDKVWFRNPKEQGRDVAEIIEYLGSKWDQGISYKIRIFRSYLGFDNEMHITSWEHKKPVGFRDLQPRAEG